MNVIDHIGNRDRILAALREEIVGPSPQGREIDCSGAIRFETEVESRGPWRQAGSGEEILLRDPPFQRYGVGLLCPIPAVPVSEDDLHDLEQVPGSLSDEARPDDADVDLLSDDVLKRLEQVADRVHGRVESEAVDFVLSTANAHKPSSMGISFLADLRPGATLTVSATGGRYHERSVEILEAGAWPRTWWLRSPVSVSATFRAESIMKGGRGPIRADSHSSSEDDGFNIRCELFSRPYESKYLITLCLVNRSDGKLTSNESYLFQSRFSATLVADDGTPLILPYPGPPADKLDDEEQSLDLVYRSVQTFAVGHGCAADWVAGDYAGRVAEVRAECFPVVETPSTTPEIRRSDGSTLAVPMRALAGLDAGNDGMAAIQEIVDEYGRWIDGQKSIAQTLESRYHPAAQRHIEACEECHRRMLRGLAFLQSNATARRAFQLANYAMLLQQIRSRRDSRLAQYDAKSKRITFDEPFTKVHLQPPKDRGEWRPFQIAFILAALESAANGESSERQIVELIWFPTGGGKTEAYLGLSAFAIFFRRLTDPDDVGVHVLMRYTLRLLTAQQFQRASSLLCAMEYLRLTQPDRLGEAEFSIGIWLGGETTPNSRRDAIKSLEEIKRVDGRNPRNPFLLTRCPWCGAQIGPIRQQEITSRSAPRVLGYSQEGNTVRLRCSDPDCDFFRGLPVYVIDEDIYDQRPSLIIGTVDKFAMLAWRPEARAIFGIDSQGKRFCSPPGVIIQDELHLISGPLGSMVGLYETVIDELCTDHRGNNPVPPKLVSSTATIRRYREQIRALYARDRVALFPPPGLDAGDSFFARYARHEDGTLQPGRKYIGIHAPGLGSLQTAQARVFAALLQAPMSLPARERDPWWTHLIFFNSLRELGSALSLFQSRVPDYLWAIKARLGLEASDLRRIDTIKELTSRLRSDQIPAAITELDIGIEGASAKAVDACLASSIVEVGIDIDRLTLMTVVGQPKTTSQYIQVTGRVGRSWWERPGLVVALLSPARPRDRSHFERFRSYHERLYAQVEPTSVTPFSPPALDRALHAAMAAFVRQTADPHTSRSPDPPPLDLLEHVKRLFIDRVNRVDPHEVSTTEEVFKRRICEWRRWERTAWDRFRATSSDAPLLHVAGAYISAQDALVSWPTPMSMRSVDAECQAEITMQYLIDDGDEGSYA